MASVWVSQSLRLSVCNAIAESFSSVDFQYFCWNSSILASNPRGTILSGCAPWVLYSYLFESLQWHKEYQWARWKYHDPKCLPYGGPCWWIPPSAWRKARDLISSSANLVVDVMIRAIPRYCAICALLKQFCSLLSTNTLISLRLNSFDLLPLETFNKEDIFIWVKKKNCIRSTDTKKPIFVSTIFLSLFSHLLACTNPTSLMGAKQYALILFLFVFSVPYVFDNLRTTK